LGPAQGEDVGSVPVATGREVAVDSKTVCIAGGIAVAAE
jgi:hypothetical protein